MTDPERQSAIRERFDGRADSYDDSAMHRALAAAVADFVDLDGVATVLDVATGTGLALRALAARLDESDAGAVTRVDAGRARLAMLGVDLSPGTLAVARRELPTAEFIDGEAEALPVADASADLVLCVTALHIFADPSLVFEEFARVVAPGGTVVTATFAEAPDHGHGHGRGAPQTPGYIPNHEPFATPEALAASVASAGFVVTHTEFHVFGSDKVLIAELAPVD